MGFLSSIAPFMGAVGMAVAIWLYMTVARESPGNARMQEIAEAIRDGAMAFLRREARILLIFEAIVHASTPSSLRSCVMPLSTCSFTVEKLTPHSRATSAIVHPKPWTSSTAALRRGDNPARASTNPGSNQPGTGAEGTTSAGGGDLAPPPLALAQKNLEGSSNFFFAGAFGPGEVGDLVKAPQTATQKNLEGPSQKISAGPTA